MPCSCGFSLNYPECDGTHKIVKKVQKEITDIIIEDYMSCPNIVEADNKIYCYTWWKHDDCERLMNLLYKITKNNKYTLPEMRKEVKEAINEMIDDEGIRDILERLGSDYDKNGVPYWEKYKDTLKNMGDSGI